MKRIVVRKTILYRYFDDQRRLLYVGITGSFQKRAAQHERGAPWVSEATRVTLEHFPDRESARIAERMAIESEYPKFNIVFSMLGNEKQKDAKKERNMHIDGDDVKRFVSSGGELSFNSFVASLLV